MSTRISWPARAAGIAGSSLTEVAGTGLTEIAQAAANFYSTGGYSALRSFLRPALS